MTTLTAFQRLALNSARTRMKLAADTVAELSTAQADLTSAAADHTAVVQAILAAYGRPPTDRIKIINPSTGDIEFIT